MCWHHFKVILIVLILIRIKFGANHTEPPNVPATGWLKEGRNVFLTFEKVGRGHSRPGMAPNDVWDPCLLYCAIPLSPSNRFSWPRKATRALAIVSGFQKTIRRQQGRRRGLLPRSSFNKVAQIAYLQWKLGKKVSIPSGPVPS